MKQIIEDIKQQIKEKKAELAKLEAALGKLTGDAVPKAARTPSAGSTRQARTSSAQPVGNGSTGSGSSATTESLPDRIITLLAPVDGTYRFPGGLSADDISKELLAPVANVRTTCSRLAKENRLATTKEGRSVRYLGLKSEAPVENPFAAETN